MIDRKDRRELAKKLGKNSLEAKELIGEGIRQSKWAGFWRPDKAYKIPKNMSPELKEIMEQVQGRHYRHGLPLPIIRKERIRDQIDLAIIENYGNKFKRGTEFKYEVGDKISSGMMRRAVKHLMENELKLEKISKPRKRDQLIDLFVQRKTPETVSSPSQVKLNIEFEIPSEKQPEKVPEITPGTIIKPIVHSGKGGKEQLTRLTELRKVIRTRIRTQLKEEGKFTLTQLKILEQKFRESHPDLTKKIDFKKLHTRVKQNMKKSHAQGFAKRVKKQLEENDGKIQQKQIQSMKRKYSYHQITSSHAKEITEDQIKEYFLRTEKKPARDYAQTRREVDAKLNTEDIDRKVDTMLEEKEQEKSFAALKEKNLFREQHRKEKEEFPKQVAETIIKGMVKGSGTIKKGAKKTGRLIATDVKNFKEKRKEVKYKKIEKDLIDIEKPVKKKILGRLRKRK